MFHKNNFYRHTYCVFEEVFLEHPLTFHFRSEHQSEYHFTKEGVYRKSNHWGRVGNCRWKLNSQASKTNQVNRVGFAKWSDFFPNDEQKALFYVFLNSQDEPQMGHVQEDCYDAIYPKRILADAQKRIKEINAVLQDQKWAAYLIFDDFEILKNQVLTELLNSKKTWTEIKRGFLK
jgi:hypothetical protein